MLRKVHSNLKDMYYLNTNTKKLSNPTLGSSSVKLNVQRKYDYIYKLKSYNFFNLWGEGGLR